MLRRGDGSRNKGLAGGPSGLARGRRSVPVLSRHGKLAVNLIAKVEVGTCGGKGGIRIVSSLLVPSDRGPKVLGLCRKGIGIIQKLAEAPD